MSLRKQLQGTGVALITPFTADLKVDFDALGKVIDFLIDGGVEYLVTLGTTGETPTLDKQEKLDIAHYTTGKIAGRVPLVVGIGGNNTAEILKDLEKYPLDKAIAVLSASPSYNKPSQEGIFQHYKAIAEASPKPVLLYNVPGRTGRNMSAATTLRLAQEVPNIAGMKEASGDFAQCMEILRDMPEDFLLVSGDDAIAMPLIACGMTGVISVAANAFPRQFSDMIRLSLKADFAGAKKLNDTLMEAYDLMFVENNPSGVKAFMAEMGLIKNEVRLPVVPLSDAVHDKVKRYLSKK
ncbi:4-hydroxy-tetrahydrodipicolinate synthase [Sediminibacterium soli]|uniref:4-hydroxy-tetrahydrodipicolinate synthase n=1 Tax=Sediminibacterium soli TaxID=2698829 RepID=UPI00137B39AC|nr:4-hydroxy-tetrahydrodipicolinate synthase [Sediminibacterium soli]NCI45805.1 4-hydroxy-tetrahydrodipicolinate synthase [Sediminibacterium soli]